MVDDLSGLGPQGFERLSQALAVRVLGPGVEVFGEGPDGGREATFRGRLPYPNPIEPWDGYGVLQAKYKAKIMGTGSDTAWLRQQVSAELKAWSASGKKRVLDGRLPEYLIFVTNVSLSAVPGKGGKDQIDALIRSYATALGLKGWAVWDGITVCTLLDSYPDVRRAFRALITPNEVLAAMHDRLTAPPVPSRVDVVLPGPQYRPGQPGHEATFQTAYDVAGGAGRFGEAMGEVQEAGPGWVQHFPGGPYGEPAVLVELPGKPASVLARTVWDDLQAIGGGLPNSGTIGIGFPAVNRADPDPFIGSDRQEIELEGGQWGRRGRGRLIRRPGKTPVWQPEIVLDSEASRDKDSWTSLSDKRDLRLRLAGRIPLAVEDWGITDRGRAKMLTALQKTGLGEVCRHLADRYGLDAAGMEWQEIDEPDGHNNSRFSAYHLTATGAEGRPAVSICLYMVLPDGYTKELRTVVDLRIDFTALAPAMASNAPLLIPVTLRVSMAELIEFFIQAWRVATMVVPLAALDDPISAQPAGAPRVELYIQSERPEYAGTDRTVRPLDMVDLSSLGVPRSSQSRDLSVAATAPLGLSGEDVDRWVRQALDRMAADFGLVVRPPSVR
ncbi:hypothetical protein [Amycolatopsis sp. NPDC051716]|uniref:hypothetical protein n=1 Tax=Amycolatopsis sp. NPDC051716 TaxID=3155804 RepID=UPI0034442C3D